MNKFKSLPKNKKTEHTIFQLRPLFVLFARLGKACKSFGARKKRITASAISFAMILTMIPMMTLTSFATDWSGVSSSGIGFNYNSNDFINISMPTTNSYYTYGTCTTLDGTTTAEVTASNVSSLPASGWNWAVKNENTTENDINCSYTVTFNDFNLNYSGTNDVLMFKTNINLILQGENIISGPNAGTALSSYGTSVIISGTGSLEATGKSRGINLTTGNLYIKSGKVKAVALDATNIKSIDGIGVSCKLVTVDSGELIAINNKSNHASCGISCDSITQNGGYITAQGGATEGSYQSYGLRIEKSSGKCTINGGTLTATSLYTSGKAMYLSSQSVSYGEGCSPTVWAGNDEDSAVVIPKTSVTNTTYTSNKYVQISDNIAYPTSWADLQAKINESAKIKLTQDIVALSTDTSLNVPSGVTATIDLNGHKIDGNDKSGSVIKVNSGNLTVNDTSAEKQGQITGGKNSDGGGVKMDHGTFTMTGGKITNSSSTYYGGGVYMDYGTCTLNDVSIENNKAHMGGGVYVNNGTFTMNGGQITENTSNSYAGGLYNLQGKATLADVSITNNKAEKNGGALINSWYLYVSGSTTIKDNTLTDGTTVNNAYIKDTKYLFVNGALTGEIHLVTESKSYPVTVAKPYDYTLTQSDVEKLKCDVDGYEVALSGTNAVLQKESINTWLKLQNAIKKGGYIKLTQDIVAQDTDTYLVVPNGVTVTIDLNGYKIDRALTTATYAGIVLCVDSGNLNIIDTSTSKKGEITGANCSMGGGGVYVIKGTFTMTGGNITGNTASSGGGVYVNSGTFTMTGGNITGNTAINCGGGVYVGNGTFTMTGGNITGNTAISCGGGVYNVNIFNISGKPTIKDNTINNSTTKSNVYLKTDKFITVNGALTGEIGVTTQSRTYPVTAVNTDNYTLTNSDLSSFYSDIDSLEAALDTTANVINIQIKAVYSVDITWGSMEFTYGGESWNDNTHKWENGAWTCGDNANLIMIKNNSNVAVTANLSYSKTDSSFDVSLKDLNGTDISSIPISKGSRGVAYISLIGAPTTDMNKKSIGSVTVVIS